MLNGMIIEQQELQKESFKHKIKYYDRFSDGYVEGCRGTFRPNWRKQVSHSGTFS